MVEPAQSAPQLQAAGLRRSDRTLPCATATSPITADGIPFLMPDAEASISDEPGAGIRHAGICAGTPRATGRPAVMEDTRGVYFPLSCGKLRLSPEVNLRQTNLQQLSSRMVCGSSPAVPRFPALMARERVWRMQLKPFHGIPKYRISSPAKCVVVCRLRKSAESTRLANNAMEPTQMTRGLAPSRYAFYSFRGMHEMQHLSHGKAKHRHP